MSGGHILLAFILSARSRMSSRIYVAHDLWDWFCHCCRCVLVSVWMSVWTWASAVTGLLASSAGKAAVPVPGNQEDQARQRRVAEREARRWDLSPVVRKWLDHFRIIFASLLPLLLLAFPLSLHLFHQKEETYNCQRKFCGIGFNWMGLIVQ